MAETNGSRVGVMGLLAATAANIVAPVAWLWNKVTSDGHLAAAARQGADEIGMALKAFPESISVQETGTLWNPTQAEITNSRKDLYRSPSEFSHGHGLYGADHAEDRGHTMKNAHRSPSDLAAERSNQPSPQQHEQEHEHDNGRGL